MVRMRNGFVYGKKAARGFPCLWLLSALLVALAMGATVPVVARADEAIIEGGPIQSVDEQAAYPVGGIDHDDTMEYELTYVEDEPESVTLRAQSELDTSPEALEALIYGQLVKRDETPVDVSAFEITSSDFNTFFKDLLEKHPELFDVVSWEGTHGSGEYLVTVAAKYALKSSHTDEQVLAMRAKFVQGIADAMAWIPTNGTDLEKVKAAHDWMCTHVSYYYGSYAGDYTNYPTPYGNMHDNQDPFYAYCAYGAFGERSCVCEGFAYAFKILMDRVGVDCYYVYSEDHGWNLVRVDGDWYHVDTTWDSNSTDKVDENDQWDDTNQISYTFFMKSTEGIIEFEKRYGGYYGEMHTIDPVVASTLKLPEANNTQYDEYMHPYWRLLDPPIGVQAQNSVTDYYISEIGLTLSPGQMTQLSVTTIVPETANKEMAVWSSSDPDVAAVFSDGTVVAIGQGHATIYCNIRGFPEECNVEVGEDTRPKPISGATIEAIPEQEYLGEPLTPEPKVTLGDVELIKDVDYKLTYENNDKAGTGKVIVSGIGSYFGTATAEFTIFYLPSPTFASAQLILGEQLVLRFGIDLPEEVDYSDGYAVFSIGGKNARKTDPIPLSKADYNPSLRYPGFFFELSSIEMAEPVTCTFTYAEGRSVSKDFSVKEYVQLVMDAEEGTYYNNVINCVKAVANYGHYVQPFLAQNAKWTVGKDYKEMDLFFAEANDINEATRVLSRDYYSAKKTVSDGASLKATCSLTLNSYTTFDVYLSSPEGEDIEASATFGSDGRAFVSERQSDGRYRIRFDKIKAPSLQDEINITGNVGGHSFSIVLPPLSYAGIVLNGDWDQVAKEAMTALYWYSETAWYV